MIADNPLLDFSAFPRFDTIQPAHIEPGLAYILNDNREQIRQLLRAVTEPTWDNFMAPLGCLDDRLARVWSVISHLQQVCDSEPIRQAYQACLPQYADYVSELGQNRAIYDAVGQVHARADFAALSRAQRTVIENALRDFRLAGVGLTAEQQARCRQINRRLAELGNRFAQNLLDATEAWHLLVEDREKLAGLPERVMALAGQAAQAAGQDGWRFGLRESSYVPFMTYCDDAALRRQMYTAYATRASEVGPSGGRFDNGPLIDELLSLRHQQATLLGFAHYADYSLATKMADSVQQIADFLMRLAVPALAAAKCEWRDVRRFAQQQYGLSEVRAWDRAWVSEKMRQHRFDFSAEALRPYFPLSQVLHGLFETVGRVFGIAVQAWQPAPPVWHETVQCYRVFDQSGALCGYFYLDLFSRSGKQGGAWMADHIGRRRSARGVQHPVAFLTCNFSSPTATRPSLLSHDEIVTLFHEFGHGLHHILTRVEVAGVDGINGVPWDAVELPSQLLENWCRERAVLELASSHVDSGDPVPAELLDKLLAARNFQSAMQMLRQIEFGLFDLKLHSDPAPSGSPGVQAVLDQVRATVAVVVPPDFERFPNSFAHIFAGEYAAGYYSYQWAEVLAADAYGLFEQRGIFDRSTGQAFAAHILQRGGVEDIMHSFAAFRGRQPQVDALLRHAGLGSQAAA